MRQPCSRLKGVPSNVRGKKKAFRVSHMKERMTFRQGFFHVHIYTGPGNEALVKGARQVLFNGNASASCVHKKGRTLHFPQLIKADKTRRAFIVWGVDGNDIGL